MITLFLVIFFGLMGFLIGGLIFGKEIDGTMYFYIDSNDGIEYTFAKFNAQNIHEIDEKSSITLHCVKLPPDFNLDEDSHPERRL